MGKLLHPGYFPIDNCNAYPNQWRDFTLEQAMAAYWKVSAWNFSISSYSNGGGGSLGLNVDAGKMSDLVCSTYSDNNGVGSDEVLTLSADVGPTGLFFDVVCFDDIFFTYDSSVSVGGGSQPVTIIIGNQTISTSAIKTDDNVSATITITATAFFDIEN